LNIISTIMKKYHYSDGREVVINDVVLAPRNKSARVKIILEPDSSLAHAYSSPIGGIVLEFDDGDVQVWPEADEDLQFIRRD
jgi:hypothetical protein